MSNETTIPNFPFENLGWLLFILAERQFHFRCLKNRLDTLSLEINQTELGFRLN